MIKLRRSALFSTVAFASIGTLGCSTAPTASTPSTPAAAAASSSHVVATATAGLSRPVWAASSALSGRLDGAEKLSLQVHLAMRNQAAAAAELAELENPDSAKFGQFLSDEEFDAKYAPTEADVAAVRAHLEANGLSVTHVPENRAYIAVEGSAAQAESAFSTHLGLYQVNKELRRAPIDQPSLPAELQSRVSTVVGLSTPQKYTPRNARVGGIKLTHPANPNKPADATTANICSEWFGQIPDTVDPAYPGYAPLTYGPCGYHPGQVRNAYGFGAIVRGGNDGTGQTIAIVDAYLSPTLLADAQTYAANNDPDYPFAKSQLKIVQAPGTPSTPDTGWYTEQSLDLEAAHAIAPGAKIVAVVAQSSSDPDLMAAVNVVVSKKLANIISNSWAENEGGADLVAWTAIAQQANLKGVGLYFSTGDNGDETFGGFYSPSVNFPSSLAEVTAVGGTSLAIGQQGQTLFESGWQTGLSFTSTTDANGNTVPTYWTPDPPGEYIYGAGGGTSRLVAQPAWQKGVVPAALANINHPAVNAPARVIPDVSMLADPDTGLVIGVTDPSTGVYGEPTYGGTSLSCPLFAATIALAQQNAGRAFGNANALLYKAAKKNALRDITPPAVPTAVAFTGGVLVTFDYNLLSIVTTKGFDTVTGLGAPNGKTFFANVK
jgi:subtilase family serine protease